MNYSSESPDGSALITLGDDCKVQVHRRDATGRAHPHQPASIHHIVVSLFVLSWTSGMTYAVPHFCQRRRTTS